MKSKIKSESCVGLVARSIQNGVFFCVFLCLVIPLYTAQAGVPGTIPPDVNGDAWTNHCGPTVTVERRSSYESAGLLLGAEYTYPFQDPCLPVEDRVNDLISRLTLDEKISLMHQWEPAISRLGIASFRTGTEALHGVAWLGEATVFPQAIGLASTWDPNLVKQIGSAVGDEVRVYHQIDPIDVGVSVWSPVVDAERDPRAGRTEEGYSEDPYLTGRMSTAYCSGLKGDDPFYYRTIPTLKHFYAYNQEENRITTHVVIDERNQHEYYLEFFRYAIEAGAAKSMMTAYNFVNGVPCTVHPDVNGIVKAEWAPIAEGDDFFVVTDAGAPGNLTGSQGYYSTAAQAHAGMILAGIDSMTQDSENPVPTIANINAALNQGLITEADINMAVRNILRVRFHTGEFDPNSMNPYANVPETELCSAEHAALSLQAAREAVVLLKNEGNVLPIDKNDINSVALIGPLADELFNDFYGGTFPYEVTALQAITDKLVGKTIIYSSGNDKVALKALANSKYVTTHGETSLIADSTTIGTNQTFELDDWDFGQYTFKSIANKKYVTDDFDTHLVTASRDYPDDWFVNEIFNLVSKGGDDYLLKTWFLWANFYVKAPNGGIDPLIGNSTGTGTAETFTKELITDGLAEAVAAASSADIALVFVGNCPVINGSEDEDRPYITLEPDQQELVEEVYGANPNTIVVLVSSYPVAINWTNDNVPAIVYTSHGGQEMGTALADVLFGDYSPAGRLTETWYSSLSQIPAKTDYDIIDGNRTYMYFEGTPLYPFGHGLTYTTFDYNNLQLSSSSIPDDGNVAVSVDVTNTGSVASDEVVQLYVKDVEASVKRPIKELLGFERVSLSPAQTKTVSFNLPASELAFWDVSSHDWLVEEGYYDIMVGSSSADIRLTTPLYVGGTVNVPPNVSITSPLTGATFAAGEDIVIEANASDSDGSVTKVEFFQGSTKLGEDTSSPYSCTWSYATPGPYSLTARATDNNDAITTSGAVNISVNSGVEGSGAILREWWAGISGTDVSDMTSDANYPDESSGRELITSMEGPTNWADNYGTRIRGYLHPPADGSYTFWIASDDNSELWLSNDDSPDNVSLIASVSGSHWTNPREWDKYSEQESSPIALLASQKYYIEVLHKAADSNDNVAVAWEGPSISQQVIGGLTLSPCCLDFRDFSRFAVEWYLTDCSADNSWCSGADFNRDGSVTLEDLRSFAISWLAGTE